MNSIITGSNPLIVNYYSAYFEMLELPNEHYNSISIGMKRAAVNSEITNILIILENRDDFNAYARLKDTLDEKKKNIIIICVSDDVMKLVTSSKVITFSHKELTLDFSSTLSRMHVCKPYLQASHSEKSPQKILEFIKFMLVKGNISLPINSECAMNILTSLDRDNISFKTINEMTRTDPAIHAGIIKMANSAYFCGAFCSIGDVERALVRVGLINVKVYLINFINKSLAANKNLVFFKEIGQTIDRSVKIASCCYGLAEFLKVCSPITMFSLGLMSLLGEIFMYAAISDYFADDGLGSQSPDAYISMAEKNGRMVSGMLLKKWKFSEEYFVPVMNSCSLGENSYTNETKLLHIGSSMVRLFDTGKTDDELMSALAGTDFMLNESQLLTLREEVIKHHKEIIKVLS